MSLLLAFEGFTGITDAIFSIIGTLVYPLFSILFVLIQMVEGIFKAFAGMDDISFGGKPITSGNSGQENDTGLIFYLLNNETVKDLFISILVLALFLVVIFTVMAFIKNIYSAKPKDWKEIIFGSIKGLANFIFLPVCCLLGVWLGNILLQAINGATSNGGATAMDRKLFIASAYNANKFRQEDQNKVAAKDDELVQDLKTMITLLNFGADVGELFGIDVDKINNIQDGQTYGYYADIVDQIYSTSYVSIYDYVSVGSFYNLWQINYLVLIVGGIFMLYVLFALAFGMVKRMFYLLVLYVISPALCAMYPLDDGAAVKSWSGEFKKQVISAYGAVAGINIFFSLVPLIEKIELMGTLAGFMSFNDIFQIFLLVSGLLVVKDLISLISGFVGGGNAYADGQGLMNSTRSAMKKYGGGTVNKVSGAFGAYKGMRSAGKGFWSTVGSGVKSIGKTATKELTGGIFDIDGIKKSYEDKKKSTRDEAIKNYRVGTQDEIKEENNKFKGLLTKRDKDGKIPLYDIAEFLNSVKDDTRKAEFEEALLARNNRINRDKGKKLDKDGSYIEKAKEYDEYKKKTTDSDNKAIERALDKVITAKKLQLTAGDDLNALIEGDNLLKNVRGGKINGIRAKDGTYLDTDAVKNIILSGTKLDLADYKEGSRETVRAINEKIDAIKEAEEKQKKATERLAAMQESLADSTQAAADHLEAFAKSMGKKDDNLTTITDGYSVAAKEFVDTVKDKVDALQKVDDIDLDDFKDAIKGATQALKEKSSPDALR